MWNLCQDVCPLGTIYCMHCILNVLHSYMYAHMHLDSSMSTCTECTPTCTCMHIAYACTCRCMHAHMHSHACMHIAYACTCRRIAQQATILLPNDRYQIRWYRIRDANRQKLTGVVDDEILKHPEKQFYKTNFFKTPFRQVMSTMGQFHKAFDRCRSRSTLRKTPTF